MYVLALEGLPGAGKTTLLEQISTLLDKNITLMTEPIQEFQTFEEFNPLMELYEEPFKNGSVCQCHIIDVLTKRYKKYVDFGTDKLVSDRCLGAVEVFTNTMKEMGYLTNFSKSYILKYWENNVASVFPDKRYGTDSIFYIDIPVTTSISRIRQRGRVSEKNVSYEYLDVLKNQYEKFLHKNSSSIKIKRVAFNDTKLKEKFLIFCHQSFTQ